MSNCGTPSVRKCLISVPHPKKLAVLLFFPSLDTMASPTRSVNPPVLQRLSQYPAAARYSLQPKWRTKAKANENPPPNKYDVREKVTSTSKFGIISMPCGTKAFNIGIFIMKVCTGMSFVPDISLKP